MSLIRIGGGLWTPTIPGGLQMSNAIINATDTLLVDADQEEVQIIGSVSLAGGSGSKTFSTGSPSAIGWLPGATITFGAVATLRVGLKKTTLDLANGPPNRATIGNAAFDVFKDLVGGTDTIVSTTWREDAMASGSNTTVSNGDMVCISFCLNLTSGTQSVKVRANSPASNFAQNTPSSILVTAGPTYTPQALMPNIVLTFSDGSIGYVDPCFVFSSSGATEVVGNGNIYGNVITPLVTLGVDAIAAFVTETGTTNFDMGLYSDPNGTPTAIANGTVSVDPQVLGTSSNRGVMRVLPSETVLSKNTPYLAGVKQNSASAITIAQYDVSNAAYFQANGLDSTYFAAKSTAGGAVAAQNSGKRRCALWLRVSSIDGGGAHYKPVIRMG